MDKNLKISLVFAFGAMVLIAALGLLMGGFGESVTWTNALMSSGIFVGVVAQFYLRMGDFQQRFGESEFDGTFFLAIPIALLGASFLANICHLVFGVMIDLGVFTMLIVLSMTFIACVVSVVLTKCERAFVRRDAAGEAERETPKAADEETAFKAIATVRDQLNDVLAKLRSAEEREAAAKTERRDLILKHASLVRARLNELEASGKDVNVERYQLVEELAGLDPDLPIADLEALIKGEVAKA